jgi:hypothetical protein
MHSGIKQHVDIFGDRRKPYAAASFSRKEKYNLITESLWRELCDGVETKEKHYPFPIVVRFADEPAQKSVGWCTLTLRILPYFLPAQFWVLQKLPQEMELVIGKQWIEDHGSIATGSFVPHEGLCYRFTETPYVNALTRRFNKLTFE